MNGELANIPTDSLIDMLFVILTGELAVTENDVTEIEEIQRELRGEARTNTGAFTRLTKRNVHQAHANGDGCPNPNIGAAQR